MPNTSEGFYYPDANTNIAPLETVLANMAASSNSVAQQTPRVFADYAAMVAGIPSPVGGRLAITTQGSGILWQYDGTAAKWVVQNRPTFSNATARDTAIPNPTPGIVAVIGSGATYAEYLWDGAKWRISSQSPTSVAVIGSFSGGGSRCQFAQVGRVVTVEFLFFLAAAVSGTGLLGNATAATLPLPVNAGSPLPGAINQGSPSPVLFLQISATGALEVRCAAAVTLGAGSWIGGSVSYLAA